MTTQFLFSFSLHTLDAINWIVAALRKPMKQKRWNKLRSLDSFDRVNFQGVRVFVVKNRNINSVARSVSRCNSLFRLLLVRKTFIYFGSWPNIWTCSNNQNGGGNNGVSQKQQENTIHLIFTAENEMHVLVIGHGVDEAWTGDRKPYQQIFTDLFSPFDHCIVVVLFSGDSQTDATDTSKWPTQVLLLLAPFLALNRIQP